MANDTGVSAHIQVPASIPNYDATSDAPLGVWESVDPRSGPCAGGTFEVSGDFPSTGDWKQT